MKTTLLAAAAVATLGLAACQASTTNEGNTRIEVNGSKIEEGVRDVANTVEQGAREGVNIARNVGNDLRPVANAVGNGARAAWNEVRQELGNNENSNNNNNQ